MSTIVRPLAGVFNYYNLPARGRRIVDTRLEPCAIKFQFLCNSLIDDYANSLGTAINVSHKPDQHPLLFGADCGNTNPENSGVFCLVQRIGIGIKNGKWLSVAYIS